MYPAPYAPASPYGVPHPAMRLRRGVGGLGIVVSVLFSADVAVLLAKTVAFGWRYSLAAKLEARPGSVSYRTVDASDNFVATMSGLHVILCIAIFVVLL